jgi:hypothetical protein
MLASRLAIEDLGIRWPDVTEYIAANNMALTFYSYGKNGFSFQNLCILPLINNVLTNVIKLICLADGILDLIVIHHTHLLMKRKNKKTAVLYSNQ